MQPFQTTNILFCCILLHLWDTCRCLHFCLTGARRAPKFAVKNKKSVFFQGASHLHLTGASLAPGPRPGFPYLELSEVWPNGNVFAVFVVFSCTNQRRGWPCGNVFAVLCSAVPTREGGDPVVMSLLCLLCSAVPAREGGDPVVMSLLCLLCSAVLTREGGDPVVMSLLCCVQLYRPQKGVTLW